MFVALAIILLIVGGLVYLAFRSLSLTMFGWLESLGLMGTISDFRMMFSSMHPSSFVLYNLPDLLWIISYLLFVNGLITKNDRAIYLFWVLFLPILAIGHEILQGLGLMSGSFDIIDLLCYIVPTTINLVSLNITKFNVKLTQISYEKVL